MRMYLATQGKAMPLAEAMLEATDQKMAIPTLGGCPAGSKAVFSTLTHHPLEAHLSHAALGQHSVELDLKPFCNLSSALG